VPGIITGSEVSDLKHIGVSEIYTLRLIPLHWCL
jgi:hypothetical protein